MSDTSGYDIKRCNQSFTFRSSQNIGKGGGKRDSERDFIKKSRESRLGDPYRTPLTSRSHCRSVHKICEEEEAEKNHWLDNEFKRSKTRMSIQNLEAAVQLLSLFP